MFTSMHLTGHIHPHIGHVHLSFRVANTTLDGLDGAAPRIGYMGWMVGWGGACRCVCVRVCLWGGMGRWWGWGGGGGGTGWTVGWTGHEDVSDEV